MIFKNGSRKRPVALPCCLASGCRMIAAAVAATWCVKLEGPKEVGRVFEVRSNSEDLVNDVFHTDDTELAQRLFDHVVGSDGFTVTIDLDMSPLVNQLTNRLQVWASPGYVWLTDSKHVQGGLVQFDKNAIVDLSQSEQLQNLLDLGCNLVDTTNPHDKGKLSITWDVVVSILSSLTPQSDLITLLVLVFLGEFLSTFEYLRTLDSAISLGFHSLLGPESSVLRLPLPPLQDGFRNGGEFSFHRHGYFSCRSESSNKSL